uniref:Uncharacterized protein n=1 Tax=Arundo donax TaxID=35708 RepID=A0A0A8ZF78_ARUDO
MTLVQLKDLDTFDNQVNIYQMSSIINCTYLFPIFQYHLLTHSCTSNK